MQGSDTRSISGISLNENQTWFVGGAFILTTIVPFSNVQWILNNSGTYWATPYQTPSATPPIDQSLASLECPKDVSVELQGTQSLNTIQRRQASQFPHCQDFLSTPLKRKSFWISHTPHEKVLAFKRIQQCMEMEDCASVVVLVNQLQEL